MGVAWRPHTQNRRLWKLTLLLFPKFLNRINFKIMFIPLVTLFIVSLLLPAISSYYFNLLMRFIRVRRGAILVAGALAVWLAYIFFMLPWIFIGEDVLEVRLLAYSLSLIGLLIFSYGVIRIYMDWREVIR